MPGWRGPRAGPRRREALEGSGATEQGLAAPHGRDAMPVGEEPGERGGIHGLDFAPQAREGLPAEQAQHIGVAPLALGAARPELPPQDRARGEQPFECILHGLQRHPPPTCRLVRQNGRASVPSGRAGPSSALTAGPRNALGTPAGASTPIPSRYRATSSMAIQRPSLAIRTSAARRVRRAPRASGRPPQPHLRCGHLVRRQVAQRRSRSWTWSAVGFRSSESAWSDSSRSASASASSSSRSSSCRAARAAGHGRA